MNDFNHTRISFRDDSGVYRLLHSAHLFAPLGSVAVGLAIALALVLVGIADQQLMQGHGWWWALLISLLMIFGGLLIAAIQLRQHLIEPLARLEASVARVCQGDPHAKLPELESGALADMVRDIGSLNEELTDLYEDMDSRISRHTTRLAQKTASLKILYDVAASINQDEDLDELLMRYLRVLKEMVNGLAATARIMQPDGVLRLVGTIGLDDVLLRRKELLPVELCQCGAPLSPGDILCHNGARHCIRSLDRRMFDQDQVEMISVPLEHHKDVLGVYNLFVRKPGVSEREDILQLLKTIGSHLGMAVAKQRLDEETRRLSIVEERNAMAHELHDSLAQTLASLRFQVRMLEDTLKKSETGQSAMDDLMRIQNGVDEAHMELRELLASFRAPVGGKGLTTALEKLVERFRQDNGIASYFQQDCTRIRLSSSDEMQIMRIVQESLANIRKHAQARNVRVLLGCTLDGTYNLLVEDDGVGFDGAARRGHPGEHIGLSIMEERARRLGGSLRIESEVGEGTRVELTYKPAPKVAGSDKKWVV